MDAEIQKASGRNLRQMIPYDCKMDNYLRWVKMVQYVAYLHEEPDNTNREA